jgi:hypothetical protein
MNSSPLALISPIAGIFFVMKMQEDHVNAIYDHANAI